MPARLEGKHPSEIRDCRICDECISKVKQPCKLPSKCSTKLAKYMNRFTRQEIRNAIQHDHTYSLPTPVNASMLTPAVCSTSLIPLPKFKVPVHFCMFQNDNSAISCYTSFRSYDHYVCFNFLGNAVNHLKYPGTSNAMTRLVRNRTLTINRFFLTLSAEKGTVRTRFSLLVSKYLSHLSHAS